MDRLIPLIIIRFMKSLLLVFVLLAFVFLPAVPRSEVLKTIDVLTGEWKPYTSKDMKGYGLASEIVTRVLKRMGYRPNYTFLPFDRAYELALESDTNTGVRGTFPFWKWSFIDRNGNVRERTREMYFSNALTKTKTKLVIFYNFKQETAIKLQRAQKIRDLSEFTLVATEGYAYPRKIIELLKSERVEGEVTAFEKLFDTSAPYIVLAEERVGKQILNERFADKQNEIKTISAKPLQFEKDIHFIASRRNPHNQMFINNFNENLEKLRAQGIIHALEAQYFKYFEGTIVRLFEGTVVRLNVPETSLIPTGRERLEDDFEYKLPRGTRAVVIEWGTEFLLNNKNLDTMRSKFTRVEIMNGPLKGKRLFIENKFIELP